MLLTIPPPLAASALVSGTFGPSFPGTRPSWLGAGVLLPEPEPVRVPLLDEYNESLVLLKPDFLITEDRLRLKGDPTPNFFKAEKALLRVPVLAAESPPMDIGPGVGADDAR